MTVGRRSQARWSHPDMVGPVKAWVWIFLWGVRYMGFLPRREEKSWAGTCATVDQSDIRGLGTDMT